MCGQQRSGRPAGFVLCLGDAVMAIKHAVVEETFLYHYLRLD